MKCSCHNRSLAPVRNKWTSESGRGRIAKVQLQKTAASPFFDCRLLNRFRPLKESASSLGECFCSVVRLLDPVFSVERGSKSRVRELVEAAA